MTLDTGDAVWEHVLAFREQAAVLARTDFSVLRGDDAQGVVAVLEEITAMTAVADQGLVRQVVDQGLATERGYTSAVPYLRDLLRVTESEAAARVRAAERFQPAPPYRGRSSRRGSRRSQPRSGPGTSRRGTRV